jgi:hypothetical protein
MIGMPQQPLPPVLGAAEEALIVIGLGRRLAPPAALATLGASHAVLPQDAGPMHGRRVAAAYRRGPHIIVLEDPQADFVLLREQDGAALYAADGARPEDPECLDAEPFGEPLARFEGAQMLRLNLIDAAALVGIAEATLDQSVACLETAHTTSCTRTRYRALEQRCASMALTARCARDQMSFAAVAIDEARTDAPSQVATALFLAGSAALENATRNLEVHAAIGRHRADAHLFLRRAQLLIAMAGGTEAISNRSHKRCSR